MAFAPGENVGAYRIIEQLGQGGMASVFKAYHPALDRFVAIKVLHPAFKEEPNFLSRFQREARVVARLEHPHIVPVYDFAEHDGQPYLVMKYIEGETLKSRLNQGPLSKQEALEIVDAVGSALTYAHKRGVLHRDVKPSNILLSPDGSIFLADFGLARMAEAGASTLSKDVMLGTPQYISPEQAKGNIELREGTDVYSFGVVLYELVVGRVPFNADTPFSIIHDHIYTPLPLPSKVNPNVPEVIERVLLKCLAKDPVDRFGSVDVMVQAFRAAVLEGELPGDVETIAGETPLDQKGSPSRTVKGLDESGPPSDAGSAREGTKRRRWPWIAAGLGSTVICLLMFLIAIGSAEPKDSELPESSNTSALIESEASKPTNDEEEARPVELLTDPRAAYDRAKLLESSDRNVLAAQAFIRAGDLYLRQDAFIEATDSYLRALDLDRVVFEQQDAVEDRLIHAAFMSASSEQIWPLIERSRALAPDWDMNNVFEARAHLFVGDPKTAIALIEEELRVNVDEPLAKVVWAEYELMHGDPAEAEQLLNELLLKPDKLPSWLMEHTEIMMKQVRKE
jgi:serine/threonine protein kinase